MLAQLVPCLLATTAVIQASPPPDFRLVPLEQPAWPTLYPDAYDIAPDGAIVGKIGNAASATTAAYWSAVPVQPPITILGREGTDDRSEAHAINAAGVIVGWGAPAGTTQAIPILWTLADGGRPVAWGGWHGSTTLSAGAVDVNAAGDILVALAAYPSKGGVLVPRAGAPVEITFTGASFGFVTALADDQRVAGHRYDPSSGTFFAYRWSAATGFDDLDQPAGNTSWVNTMAPDGNTVVGWSAGQVGNHLYQHAATWDAAGAIALLPYSDPSRLATDSAGAVAENARGWVVGWQWGIPAGVDPRDPRSFATVWIRGVPWLLDDLVAGPEPILYARALNDAGQIAALAIVGGVERAVRLDPMP